MYLTTIQHHHLLVTVNFNSATISCSPFSPKKVAVAANDEVTMVDSGRRSMKVSTAATESEKQRGQKDAVCDNEAIELKQKPTQMMFHNGGNVWCT